MRRLCAAASELGRSEFKQKLDLPRIPLTRWTRFCGGARARSGVDFEVRLWGSYLGEVLRRRYAGAWEMTSIRRRDGGNLISDSVSHA